MKTLQELYSAVITDDELKKAFAESAKNNRLVEFAKENGVDVTLDEIRGFFEEKGKTDKELSNDELENVAGGGCLIPDPGNVTSMVNVGVCDNNTYSVNFSNCF